MNADFARVLALLRQEKGISQRKAAAALGVSQALLSHYENGIREPGLRFVVRACDYYGVSADFILGRTLSREGSMLTSEEILNAAEPGNVLQGSILATLQSKLLSGAVGVLFELLGKLGDKAVINAASAYLGSAVYQLYRHLYRSSGANEGYFALDPHACGLGLADADRKLAEARYAAALIEDDDVVFLDGGSTVMRMTEHLKPSNALFVTNGMECAFWLLERDLRVYVAGGALKRDTASAAGAETMDSLRRYNFTKAFLGAGGVTVREGFTVADPEDAAVKALAAARARQTYMLVDSSKFGRIGAASVLHIDEASVITDQAPGREFQDYAEVTVV